MQKEYLICMQNMKDYLFLSEKDDFEAHNHYLKLILALLLLICGSSLSPDLRLPSLFPQFPALPPSVLQASDSSAAHIDTAAFA